MQVRLFVLFWLVTVWLLLLGYCMFSSLLMFATTPADLMTGIIIGKEIKVSFVYCFRVSV